MTYIYMNLRKYMHDMKIGENCTFLFLKDVVSLLDYNICGFNEIKLINNSIDG